MIATRTNFMKVNLLEDQTVSLTEIAMTDSVDSSGSPIAFHVASDMMFWVNSAKRKIYSVNINGTGARVVSIVINPRTMGGGAKLHPLDFL